MKPTEDPFTRFRATAAQARRVLRRVAGAGGILQQMARGEWDERLTAENATDTADMLQVMAEHVRSSRALAGTLGMAEGDSLSLAGCFRGAWAQVGCAVPDSP